MLEALTLDVDGTLYSLRGMVLRNLRLMLGLADFFRQLHRVRDGMRGQGPRDDFRREQARLLAEVRGGSAEQAERLVRRVIDDTWPRAFKRVRPYRSLRGVLAELVRRGLRLGLISDYPLDDKLSALGLDELPFTARVVTEEVGALKPHPAAFLRAAELLGVEPARVLHVGDREDCDVRGAHAAGMKAALLARRWRRPSSEAELVFTRWSGFIRLLESRKYLPGS